LRASAARSLAAGHARPSALHRSGDSVLGDHPLAGSSPVLAFNWRWS
jgi:hypothetical protein